MGLSAHDSAAPDVIDALRRLLPGRRVAGCRTEVVEPEFAEEPDLDVAGRRVQDTRDDERPRVAGRADDRAHLLLAHERAVREFVEMRARDRELAGLRDEHAARLILDARLARIVVPAHVV